MHLNYLRAKTLHPGPFRSKDLNYLRAKTSVTLVRFGATLCLLFLLLFLGGNFTGVYRNKEPPPHPLPRLNAAACSATKVNAFSSTHFSDIFAGLRSAGVPRQLMQLDTTVEGT